MSVRIILAVLLGNMGFNSVHAAENNIHITGNLVTEPCALAPESADIPLNFGTVISKFFQTANRTPGVPFSIRLMDCDTSMGNSATVTFTGAESDSLPGYLTPDAGQQNGLAFGIETIPDEEMQVSAQLVPVNNPSPLFLLSNGESMIRLQGFIEAEPDAIVANTVTPGPFTVTATFRVDYP